VRCNIFIEALRWGLRAHFILHIFELASALLEKAYVTAGIVIVFGLIQLLASFLLPGEHIHFHTHTKKRDSKE